MSNCVGGLFELGLPEGAVAQHSVQGCDHLAHDGDDHDLGLLARRREAIMEGLESGVVAARTEGCHVEDVFFDFPEIRSKWLELLKEAIPKLGSVAIFWEPTSGVAQMAASQSAAIRLHIRAKTFQMQNQSELEHAFAAVAREGFEAVLVLSAPVFGAQSESLAEVALRNKVPTITLFPQYARAGD